MRLGFSRILFFLIVSFSTVPDLHAQIFQRPKLGAGMSLVMGTGEQTVGIGIDARLAWVINPDLSIGTSANFINYILKGRDDAAYFFHPTVTAIVTLNAANVRSPYLIFGLGANLVLGGDANAAESGPSINAGMGWVFSLQATSLYVELIPSLIVVRSAVEMQLPVRFGVIL